MTVKPRTGITIEQVAEHLISAPNQDHRAIDIAHAIKPDTRAAGQAERDDLIVRISDIFRKRRFYRILNRHRLDFYVRRGCPNLYRVVSRDD